ncbi:hypothetical protein ACFQ0M_14140 [Kitasatospora aburaviensis]
MPGLAGDGGRRGCRCRRCPGGGGRRGRILACSDAARAAGVRQGQRLKLAQRLCPALELRDRDPEAETRRFEPVVAAVEAFTPGGGAAPGAVRDPGEGAEPVLRR